MSALKPTVKQLEFQDWEFGIFLHFGIRTFYQGHKDWDGKRMTPEAFTPSDLNCEQWACSARQAGAKYMVLTAKHHDGFANWPSKYTDFGVRNSPWKDGKGDVVREYTDACRKFGIKPGIYYSPADAACPVYKDPKAYDDYFVNQVSELLDGTYGAIDILWFDGCGSEGHKYDWARIIKAIRSMQPGIRIFNMGDPDFRWVGNESGVADTPTWNVVDSVNFSIMTDEKEKLASQLWLPAECDCMMRDRNWFFSDADAHTVKTPEELLGMYYYSVGRNSNLLLNVGPDRRGQLPEPDTASLLEFGAKVKRMFSTPLARLSDFVPEGGNLWTYKLVEYAHLPEEVAGTIRVDHVVVQEDLAEGERVKKFRVKVSPYLSGKPITVFEGNNIGHKAICRFPLIRCQSVSLEVLESDGPAKLRSLELFHSDR